MATTFITKNEAAEIISRSPHRLKTWRLDGRLKRGIHWVAVNSRAVLYNRELLLDLVANFDTPAHHEIAISNYLKSLPSSQPTIKSRAKCAA
jgi:hypothetical protein